MGAPSLAEIVLDKAFLIEELYKASMTASPEARPDIMAEIWMANREMLVAAHRRTTATEADRRRRQQQSHALALVAALPHQRG